jgi:hypothetical protein
MEQLPTSKLFPFMVALKIAQDHSIWKSIEGLAHGFFAWPNLATFELKNYTPLHGLIL